MQKYSGGWKLFYRNIANNITILIFLFLTSSLFCEIRTPDYGDKPHINSPKVVGVRHGNQLFFKIATSGKKPITYSCAELPKNFFLDKNLGIITGSSDKIEDINLLITVKNSVGEFSKPLTIMVGDNICLTPPMGWNSWYCYSESVSQEKIEAVAKDFEEQGLIDYGWSYINIDDCWQGERDIKTKILMANEKFPNLKEMCENIHNMGLKVGIYSSPWIGTYAGFRGSSCETETGEYLDILPEDSRLQCGQIYDRYPGVVRNKKNRVGNFWFFDIDAKYFAELGFDYIKVDWFPNDIPTTKKLSEDLKKSGRDIVLSLSNATPIKNVSELKKYANLWRTTGDITDNWGSISRISRSQVKWFKFIGNSAFNDPDMLQIGDLGQPNTPSKNFTKTNLTEEEQYFQLSYWAIVAAPLFLSCDIKNMDSWTKNLITNRDIIAINQAYPVYPPTVVEVKSGVAVISRKIEENIAVAVFNYGDRKNFSLNLSKILDFSTIKSVKDCWRGREVFLKNSRLNVDLKKHSAEIYLISFSK